MELEILLVIFYLFFSLFFSLYVACLFSGLFVLDGASYTVEFLFPYSFLLDIPITLVFDYISLLFFSFISLISRVVFLYRKFYMGVEFLSTVFLSSRFFFLLFLFVASMFFLVFSGSWVTLLLGWDGLGLVSFLLVIFYNNRRRLDSGFLTVFTNRVGDCFFILGFVYICSVGWSRCDLVVYSGSFFFFFLLLLGCITKRAQIPFSSWLPAAMAAPTPVSSLVHSSTLVTAGVYLLIRFNFLLEPLWPLLMLLSLATLCMAGLAAIYEMDFKKVVAMSTLRQLGVIVFSISAGFWWLSFIHIIFHAFFKRSLFLSTGTLMHYLGGGQDSRDFGSFSSSFFSKLIFVSRSLRLMGFPLFLGYYSKETLLGLMVFSDSLGGLFFGLLICFGGSVTVAYRLRLVYIGFLYSYRSYSSFSISEDVFFFLPVLLLYFFCLFLGNFFFLYFTPIVLITPLECLTWVMVVLLGVFIFKFSFRFYLAISFISSLGYLFFIRSKAITLVFSNFSYSSEYTWSELAGARGVAGVLSLIKFI